MIYYWGVTHLGHLCVLRLVSYDNNLAGSKIRTPSIVDIWTSFDVVKGCVSPFFALFAALGAQLVGSWSCRRIYVHKVSNGMHWLVHGAIHGVSQTTPMVCPPRLSLWEPPAFTNYQSKLKANDWVGITTIQILCMVNEHTGNNTNVEMWNDLLGTIGVYTKYSDVDSYITFSPPQIPKSTI